MYKILLLYILISFLVAMPLFLIAIQWLKKIKFTQFIREEGPKEHKTKKGTPTASGIIFLIIPALFLPFYHNKTFLFLYLALLLNGLIGFIDDFISAKKKKSLGLSGRKKIILQIFVSVLLFIIGKDLISTTVSIRTWSLQMGNISYFILCLLVMIGSSNAFNLTDGIDGLLGSLSIPLFSTFIIIGNIATKTISSILIGALFAYLWFNKPKAAVFMGDTGSLALGGLFGAMGIINNSELLLPIMAIIPVIETLSVIIQVSYFKLTHGKRFFKMAPIHHHFEKSGWSELKIDYRSLLITLVACIFVITIL
ncbi:MAG: phospho-N-acetylmuramoyl-pentapeptide-transferase [Caldisericota bacterium]|nr:phospho-N-acetylmuramoyl-pentapeptide-transferase [Caldisericota bacterium]